MVGRLGHPGATRDVTGRAAAWRYGDMVKAHTHPRGGTMTSVTRRSGWRVVRRLAIRDTAVMTLTALVDYHADVTENGDTP